MSWKQHLLMVDEQGRPVLNDPDQIGGWCDIRVTIAASDWQAGMCLQRVHHDRDFGDVVIVDSVPFTRGGNATLINVPGRNGRLRVRPAGPKIQRCVKLSRYRKPKSPDKA